jgi:YaiO family outer membrane protein
MITGGMMPRFLLVVMAIFISNLMTAAVLAAESNMGYDDDLKKVMEYRKAKDFLKAEELLKKMLRHYENNTELMELLAKTLYWQDKYDESIEVYRKLLGIKLSPRVKAALEEVMLAREFSIVSNLKKEGRIKEAEKKLQELYESEGSRQRAGHDLAILYIGEREYEKARLVAEDLKSLYPDDIGIEALYIETFVLAGEIAMAKERLGSLADEKKARLYESRDDLFYRVKRNNLSVEYTQLHYTKGIEDEKKYEVRLRQRIRERTFVLGYSNIDRFGQNDDQASLEIYSRLGEKTKRWGYIAGTVSPAPDFLARWTLSGAAYQGYKNLDLTIGYTYMSFAGSDVNILKPGFIAYLPYHLAWSETLYYNLDEGTSTLISKIHYEPDHKFNAYYSYAFGKSAEEIGAEADVVKLSSYSHSIGAEYRFVDRFSIGARYRFSHRAMIHDKEGVTVFVKYWW